MSDEYSVDITYGQRATHALVVFGKDKAVGESIVSPHDTFDESIGADIALGRALIYLGNAMVKRGLAASNRQDEQTRRAKEAKLAATRRKEAENAYTREYRRQLRELKRRAKQLGSLEAALKERSYR